MPDPVDSNAILNELLAAGAPAAEPVKEGQPAAVPAAEAAPPAPAENASGQVAPVDQKAPALPKYVTDALARVHEMERRLAAREKELDTKTRPAAPDKRWTPAAIRADLGGYLKSLGINTGEAWRGLAADDLGERGPAEYRALAAKLRDSGATEERIEALREEFDTMREQHQTLTQEQAKAQYRASYEQSLDQYVSGGIESTYPNAARAIRADKAGAVGEIWDIIRRDASEKLVAGIEANPMTPEEALKAFEAKTVSYQKWLAVQAQEASKPAAPPMTLANTVSAQPPVSGKPLDQMAAAEKDAWDFFHKLQ